MAAFETLPDFQFREVVADAALEFFQIELNLDVRWQVTPTAPVFPQETSSQPHRIIHAAGLSVSFQVHFTPFAPLVPENGINIEESCPVISDGFHDEDRVAAMTPFEEADQTSILGQELLKERDIRLERVGNAQVPHRLQPLEMRFV
jgi:hypothetical protein